LGAGEARGVLVLLTLWVTLRRVVPLTSNQYD
jgi:hypothetical protein